MERVNQITYWGGTEIPIDYFSMANIIIIMGLSAFFLGYLMGESVDYTKQIKKSISKELKDQQKFKKKQFVMTLFLLAISISSSFIIAFMNNFNPLTILLRGVKHASRSPYLDNQIISLFYYHVIKPLPIVVLLLYYYISFENKKSFFKKFIMFIFIIIAIFFTAPTSVARFLAVSLYIPVLLIFFKFFDKKYIIHFCSIAGIMVILPFLDKFRYFSYEKFNFEINYDFLFEGHFDAYQNFVRLISINYISYGSQLLGSLLFFIPRKFWEEKPIGSGAFLAELGHLNFSNISMPFIGEGFINFSVFGSIIFMFILGLICGMMDKYYWSLKYQIKQHSFFYLYYLCLGLLLFVMRGDFLSGFAYSSAMILVYLFILRLLKL